MFVCTNAKKIQQMIDRERERENVFIRTEKSYTCIEWIYASVVISPSLFSSS